MVKKLLSLAIALFSGAALFAQAPMQQPQELPLDPKVKSGVLPNGLHYYVQHNEEPKNRANFYIAQKVGSSLETPEQLGLAHFLEHMAFNGTSHYPGKNMLEYLQGKGIRFGADINAYTGFDETVYNINNVPSNDVQLMDSVLLCLYDWSCGILLEESEIDSERGVIEGEWRQRNNAGFRMMEYSFKQVYDEYQYQQMPIGKMEIVKTFPPKVIRDYYKTWYRPDQQGIVIVGDFDAEVMEKKVIEMFSKIPMPENAPERTYPVVSDNKEPKYSFFEDPELANNQVFIWFKQDKTPFELRNTAEYFVQDQLLLNVFAMALNNRLGEEARKADCPFAAAQVGFQNFWVAKTKASFVVLVIPKDDIEKATRSAMAIVAQACKTGFLPGEINRAKDELLSQFERAYNERDKSNNNSVAQGIIRHFIDNEPNPGAETEYQLAQQALNNVPVQIYNEIGKNLLTDENQAIVVARQKKEGNQPLPETVMTGLVRETIHADYEPYVDEEITDPLISKLPKPGKIKSTANNASFGTTEFTLSNGVKVVVKPTDFAQDQIMMTAVRKGGKLTYPMSQATNLKFIDNAFESSKLGNFKRSTLEKYMAGKQASIGFGVNMGTTTLSGYSTVKDLPVLMEMLYAGFTLVSPDQDEWEGTKSNLAVSLQRNEKDPQSIFFKRNTINQFGNNPLVDPATVADLDKANYPEMVEMIRKATANAADYTFYFVGNVDINVLKPLLEQYVATLPAKKPTVAKEISKVAYVAGDKNDTFDQPMANPAIMVFDTYTGNNLELNLKNDLMFDMMAQILDMIFTRTLREEIGGTYGAQVDGSINPTMNQWALLYLFNTSEEKRQVMLDRAHAELISLLENGAKSEDFNKVKEATAKQCDIQERKNNFWFNYLPLAGRGYDMITGRQEAIAGITLEGLNQFMKTKLLPEVKKNRIQTIMVGVENK